jgi:cellulose synthase/poly-beta-1,6-N-acetylglucosamine synthase-like glycosyltransferase
MDKELKYVVITPAYNEAKYIERVIESVGAQTVLPLRWVIVDDGSTDETAEIVKHYSARHHHIVYHRRYRKGGQAYFASNVHAIMEGYCRTRDLQFDFLAVLDADILLPRTYYEQIIGQFEQQPRLGIASGIYEDLVNGRLRRVLSDRRSTPKAIQVFRRECFEQIGGYVPLNHGGEDTCACIMARMNGWKTWSFPDIKVVHMRPTGTGNARSLLRARFTQGLCEYELSTHPVFMVAKSLRRCVLENPFVLGGISRLAGYLYGYLRREPRQMPEGAAVYARREQLQRILYFNCVPSEQRV